jgi:hypothetical protein
MHKFHIGDSVMLKPAISRNVPGGVYEVIRLVAGPKHRHLDVFHAKIGHRIKGLPRER